MRALLVFAAFSLLCAAPAHAQQDNSPSALREVYACASITDEVQRLACYDAAVGRLQQAESQGRVVTVDSDQVATLERESFGFSLPSIGALLRRNPAATPAVERVDMQIARIVNHLDGTHSFVMTNGQTWTQIEPASVSNVEVGDNIAVRRASFGSFMLSPEHGRAHRVRRSE